MRPIHITTKYKSHSYPIVVGKKQTPALAASIKSINPGTVVIITDTTVKKLYGQQLQKILSKTFPRVLLISFPAGERSKTVLHKNRIDHALLQNKCGRDTVILALGGGVVGDMAGFVASTYLRGISYIQVPTTLLAMVDSSIGGKTGIDTPYGKNLIGTFWQPHAVFVYTNFLTTLPHTHWQSGLMEAVKIAVITDPSMIHPLIDVMRKKGGKNLESIITKSIGHKARIVERDEKESGERMVLNFGHTIGHALEKVSGYTVLHGIAVGLGMVVEARIARDLGMLSRDTCDVIEGLVRTSGINVRLLRKYSVRDIIAATRYDKKRQRNEVQYILLEKLGKVYRKGGRWAHPVEDVVIQRALREIINMNI